MNNKLIDVAGTSKRHYQQDLRTIKVAVRRKDIPESNSQVQLLRDLENPEDLVVHVRHGEGQRPIFERDDVVVNPRSSSVSSEREFIRKRKYSKERSISPGKKPFDSYKEHNKNDERYKEHKNDERYKEHKSDERSRFESRSSKADLKKSEWKRSRSHSPHYSQKPSVSKVETQYRDYPSAGKPEYRRSRSRERRSPSIEKREHYSKRNRSPSRRETYSPHRSHESYRDPSFSEYRSRKRTPSPYKYKTADTERYRRRSRSPSRTRSMRSRSPYRSERCHHESSRRRSPPRSSKSHRVEYRKQSRSPTRQERYKERSRRYSRSPSHDDRRYRRSPHRSRRRSPSPYNERLDRYHPIAPPPHLAPGVVPLNYGPQWYPWPQPLGPRFIPPHAPIRLQRPPFAPIAPLIMGQRPRPPLIYNNRSTVVNKAPIITEPTTTTGTTDLSSTPIATVAAISTLTESTIPSNPNSDPCESTVNSTITIESSSKEN